MPDLLAFRICEMVSQMRNSRLGQVSDMPDSVPLSHLRKWFANAKWAFVKIVQLCSILAFAIGARKCEIALNPERDLTCFLASLWFPSTSIDQNIINSHNTSIQQCIDIPNTYNNTQLHNQYTKLTIIHTC